MFILSSNNQCYVNILNFLCFIYTDLKMTRLESLKRIVVNTYEYGKAALLSENTLFSLHSCVVTYVMSCIAPV
jgi:hypothetical protein